MTFPLGTAYVDNMDVADPNPYTPPRFPVIGAITQAPVGNTIIRVGLTQSPTDHRWEQTTHLVLTPVEREFLIAALVEHRGAAAEGGGVPYLAETAPRTRGTDPHEGAS